jgi:hypothetical protein
MAHSASAVLAQWIVVLLIARIVFIVCIAYCVVAPAPGL